MSLPGKIKLESVNQKMLLPKTTSTIPRQHHHTTVTQIQTNKRSSITGHHFVSLLLPRVYCVHTVCFSSLCSSVHSFLCCVAETSEILVSQFSRIFFHFHFSFSILSRFNFTFTSRKRVKGFYFSLYTSRQK